MSVNRTSGRRPHRSDGRESPVESASGFSSSLARRRSSRMISSWRATSGSGFFAMKQMLPPGSRTALSTSVNDEVYWIQWRELACPGQPQPGDEEEVDRDRPKDLRGHRQPENEHVAEEYGRHAVS